MGLHVNNLVKTFGETRALDGISFQVNNGETFGLLGRNGAGKTTTIRILLKIIESDEGEVLFNGKDIRKTHQRFGYLPEERGLYLNCSVCDQLLYLASLHGISEKDASKRLKVFLEKFGIPEYYKKKIRELSKGNKQKIQLIAAMIHDPDVIILDEPFSGLDPVNVQLFKDIILELKQAKKTIIFSSHRMEDVEEICDHVILLKNGREVLNGSIPQIKQKFSKNLVAIRTDQDVRNIAEALDMQVQSTRDGTYEINYSSEACVQKLFKQLIEKGLSLQHFEFKIPSLHEIFLTELGD